MNTLMHADTYTYIYIRKKQARAGVYMCAYNNVCSAARRAENIIPARETRAFPRLYILLSFARVSRVCLMLIKQALAD